MLLNECLFTINKKKSKHFKLFLAERYHSIDTKMRGNPLSLEEVSFFQRKKTFNFLFDLFLYYMLS